LISVSTNNQKLVVWNCLLDYEDHDLWAMVSGRAETGDALKQMVIELLREVSEPQPIFEWSILNGP
jgi:succinate dehydrogenase flavin-adding protein (antitoxin of CptAB toxin-antitoxin module)